MLPDQAEVGFVLFRYAANEQLLDVSPKKEALETKPPAPVFSLKLDTLTGDMLHLHLMER